LKYATLAVLPMLFTLACDQGEAPSNVTPPPDGYSNLVVFIGDGVWNPTDPSYAPPTMEEIQREHWGFSDADMAQYEADAKAFFVDRYGIDVDDPATADRVMFTSYAADPRMGYRVVSMANRVVPAEGWPINDAAFLLSIVDPAGFELGGEFAGVTVPTGTRVTYGRYHFVPGEDEPILIDFQSISPYGVDAFGVGAIRCELFSKQLGAGEANAAYRFGQEADGDFTLTASTVLTFE
jgi:hypothetical protein